MVAAAAKEGEVKKDPNINDDIHDINKDNNDDYNYESDDFDDEGDFFADDGEFFGDFADLVEEGDEAFGRSSLGRIGVEEEERGTSRAMMVQRSPQGRPSPQPCSFTLILN